MPEIRKLNTNLADTFAYFVAPVRHLTNGIHENPLRVSLARISHDARSPDTAGTVWASQLRRDP